MKLNYDPKGVFSVKSSYIMRITGSNGQGTSNLAAAENPTMGGLFQWMKNWKFSYPNKLQMFAWRLAIIVYSCTRKFRVEASSWTPFGLCPMCHRLDEDGGHMFVKCKYTFYLVLIADGI